MKALVLTAHGNPGEVFDYREMPLPTLRADDVLIRVHATSVNPVDCRVRKSSQVPRQFPLILGYDVSGTIVETGPNVKQLKPGDEVYASPNVFRDGANAEYVAVDGRSVAYKPRISHPEAAVVPLVGLTAWESLYERANLRPGQTVLIHAGAGGVGHLAIQLAQLRGCRVITTASREESIGFCTRQLGADYVINYQQTSVTRAVMELTEGKGCSVIFDTVGGEAFEQSLDCVAVNGHVVTIVPTATNTIASKLFLKNVSLHYEFMGIPTVHNLQPEKQGETLAAIANLINADLLKPHVFRQFSLENLPEAHQLLETGHVTGKISISLPG